jgi:hypothetical protein
MLYLQHTLLLIPHEQDIETCAELLSKGIFLGCAAGHTCKRQDAGMSAQSVIDNHSVVVVMGVQQGFTSIMIMAVLC